MIAVHMVQESSTNVMPAQTPTVGIAWCVLHAHFPVVNNLLGYMYYHWNFLCKYKPDGDHYLFR